MAHSLLSKGSECVFEVESDNRVIRYGDPVRVCVKALFSVFHLSSKQHRTLAFSYVTTQQENT